MRRCVGARVAVMAVVGLLAACGGGSKSNGAPSTPGSVEGITAPAVANATVSIYRLDGQMKRDAVTLLGQGTTDATGAFKVTIGAYSGMLEVAVTGGTYREPASALGAGGLVVSLAANEWSMVVPDYKAGTGAFATVSPVTTLAASTARWHVKNDATIQTAAVTYGYALNHITIHLGDGGIDWTTILPANMGDRNNSSWSPTVQAAALLGALSQETADLCVAGGTTLGNGCTLGDFVAALVGDASSNGAFDGAGQAGAISFKGKNLDPNTLRRALAIALSRFVGNAQFQATGIPATDAGVKATMNAVAGRDDPYLFCYGAVASSACNPTGLGNVPPTVVFTTTSTTPPPIGVPPEAVQHVALSIAALPADLSNTGIAKVEYALDSVPTRYPLTRISSGADAGIWTVSIPAQPDGIHVVTLYATDNLGQESLAGAGSQVAVAWDSSLPQALAGSPTALASFTSEVGMAVATDPATGAALVPAQYLLAANAQVGFLLDGSTSASTVYRSAARVGAPVSDPAELSTTTANINNVPGIRLDVLYSPATDSRIVSASARVTVDDGASTVAVDGVALLDVGLGAGTHGFYLPISSATVPALASVKALATVTVRFSFADAAGNSNQSGDHSFKFSLLPSPLVVRQDSAWTDGRDLGSAYAFKSMTASYFAAWDASNAMFVSGNVRLARFVVENPTNVPVALQMTSALTSMVRGLSAPMDLPMETLEDGVGSPSNPLGVAGVVQPSEPYPNSTAARGAYWTTSAIAGCATSQVGAYKRDPTCVDDPANGIVCDTYPTWTTTSPTPPQCSPGPEMLAYARAIHDTLPTPYETASAAGWYQIDGKQLYRNWGYYVPWSGASADPSMPNDDAGSVACTPGSRYGAGMAQTDPRTLCGSGQVAAGWVVRHIIGDTANRVVCAPPDYMSGGPAAWDFAQTAASVAAWADPQAGGGERTPATSVGGAVMVPAAVGSVPGRIVIYVSRPANAPSPRGQFDLGAVTGAGRMEKLVAHWWQDPGATNLRYVYQRNGWSTNKHLYWCENRVLTQRREAAFFDGMDEVLDGALTLDARPMANGAAVGVAQTTAQMTFSKTTVGTR